MKTNVYNFSKYKQKFDSSVVYVGDLVEWQDYTGDNYEGVVSRIEYKLVGGYLVGDNVESLPLWEKDEYVVHLQDGLQISGGTIVRKLVRKAGEKKPKALPRFSHAN